MQGAIDKLLVISHNSRVGRGKQRAFTFLMRLRQRYQVQFTCERFLRIVGGRQKSFPRCDAQI